MVWTVKESGIDFHQGPVLFPLHHSIQTISGAHFVYQMGTLSPVVKLLQLEDDHLPPPSSKVKNSGAIPPLTPTFSWHD
jgi:hypothetical protein